MLKKLLIFGSIGGFVFLAGAGLLYVLVSKAHINALAAYAIQAVFSVELSFILNYRWTWKERKPTEPRQRRRYQWRSLRRWNLQKTITILINQAIYTALIALHMQYMIANIVTTVVFAFINFRFGDKWAFAAPRPEGRHRKDK